MKNYVKSSISFTALIISLIVIFVIINNKFTENKIDRNPEHENSSKDTISENQNEQSLENIEGENNNMNGVTSKINININGTNYTATLEDNPTTREFIKRLPLELNMTELNGNEKYYYFDISLPSNSSRIDKINSGDIMLYGNDCLVLFYESFNTTYSYTKIGKIDNPSSLKSNVGNGSIKISFSK